ncbi:MAG: hypothetical protein LBF26_00800 [Puniceicoccales bacterium]|jgi:hypothetical protein|nr:hypothetical protein [Puniceicoccales bacterium]
MDRNVVTVRIQPSGEQAAQKKNVVNVTSTAVKVFRGVSTALLVLCAISAAVMLVLAFTVGSSVTVLGLVIPTITAAIIAGSLVGVLLIPTLIAWSVHP